MALIASTALLLSTGQAEMPFSFAVALNNAGANDVLAVKNYEAGATFTEEYTDLEHLERQTSVFTRKGVENVIRFAFKLAMTRPKRHLTSATKSNGIIYTMPYWDEIFRKISKEYPEVHADQFHIDGNVVTRHNHLDSFRKVYFTGNV